MVKKCYLSNLECLEKRFQNLDLICPKYGWSNDTIICNYSTYSETIKELNNPDIFL